MNKKLSSRDVGLPKGHEYVELAYHPPTGMVIAHTRPNETQLPCMSLSLRRADEMRYRPIADFSPGISAQSFTLHHRLPFLYFVTFIWSGPAPGIGLWEALHRFNLDTLRSELLAHRDELELIVPDGYQTGGLNDLLAVSDDANALFCTAAFVKAKERQDCLTKLSLSDRKLAIITRLEAMWA